LFGCNFAKKNDGDRDDGLLYCHLSILAKSGDRDYYSIDHFIVWSVVHKTSIRLFIVRVILQLLQLFLEAAVLTLIFAIMIAAM
jgi:hypothetical protein